MWVCVTTKSNKSFRSRKKNIFYIQFLIITQNTARNYKKFRCKKCMLRMIRMILILYDTLFSTNVWVYQPHFLEKHLEATTTTIWNVAKKFIATKPSKTWCSYGTTFVRYDWTSLSFSISCSSRSFWSSTSFLTQRAGSKGCWKQLKKFINSAALARRKYPFTNHRKNIHFYYCTWFCWKVFSSNCDGRKWLVFVSQAICIM